MNISYYVIELINVALVKTVSKNIKDNFVSIKKIKLG